MGLFSRGNKNNNSTPAEKKRIFGGKKLRTAVSDDYSKYSEQQLFDQLKSENWNIKNDKDKIAVLQEIENREAAAHNRPAATVVQAHGSNYGSYNYGAHSIEIRLTDNQFEDLDTLFHESEHASQRIAPISDVSFSENDKKLMRIEDMTSSDGMNSHYNKYGSSLYKVMTSELDANNAAIEKVSSFKKEFMDEEKFQEYLVGRQEYYDGLADAIDMKSSEKKAALLNTVECAYVRNELNDSEYNELRELITNTENYDLCENRTAEINETLSQIDLQNKTSIVNLSLDNPSVSNDVQKIGEENDLQLQFDDADVSSKSMVQNSSAIDQLSIYMREHDYGPDDFAEYSQDPEWRVLQREAFPDYEMPPLTQKNAQIQLSQYMNEHNYGMEDYEEYSQDSVWKELHAAAYPDYELSQLSDSKEDDISAIEDIPDDNNDVRDKPIDVESQDPETDAEKIGTDEEEIKGDEATTDKDASVLEEVDEEPETEEETEAGEVVETKVEETEAEEEGTEESGTEGEVENEVEKAEAGEEVIEEPETEGGVGNEVEEGETGEKGTEEPETEMEGVEAGDEGTEEPVTEEAAEIEVEETEAEEEETEEPETEETAEFEVEEANIGEAKNGKLEIKKGIEIEETEDVDSIMIDDVENTEYEDSNFKEESVMVKELDNSEDVTENDSKMVDDLEQTDDTYNSVSESYNSSASNDSVMTAGGDINME